MKVPPLPSVACRPLAGSRWPCKAETGLWSFWRPVCPLRHHLAGLLERAGLQDGDWCLPSLLNS